MKLCQGETLGVKRKAARIGKGLGGQLSQEKFEPYLEEGIGVSKVRREERAAQAE
jgi:hypothetical protein